jgi:hypothetical protein
LKLHESGSSRPPPRSSAPWAPSTSGSTTPWWLGDQSLTWQGYAAQQHDGPEDPNRPDNLYAPVDADRDFGDYGGFDDRAQPYSLQLWADEYRAWIALAALAGGVGDAVRNGAGKFWRGGLIGLGLGALGALGLAALTTPRPQRQVRPRDARMAATNSSGMPAGAAP